MGAGQGVWPKIFFLVHMTMSTGSLASPPPRGGDSWCQQIFDCFLPVFSLAVNLCWGMLETCASVFGHHFSHIKSHFNDLKQNFEIWGYLQKRHFTKLSAASKGVPKGWEGLALTPLTDSKFSWLRNGANYFTPKRENLGQIWNLLWKFFSKIFFSLFLIFWPKYLALADNFQCQEDLILWNFLYDNCEKKMSADFSCLFTFFKKKFKRFQILLSLR